MADDDPIVISPEREQEIAQQVERLKAHLRSLETEFTRKAGQQEYAQRLREIAAEQGQTNRQIENLLKLLPVATRNLLEASDSSARLKSELRGTMFESMGLGDTVGKLEKAFFGAGAEGSKFGDKLYGVGAAAFFLGTNIGKALIAPFGDTDKVIAGLSPKLSGLNNLFREYHRALDLVNVGYLALGKSMEEVRGRGDRMIDAVQKTTAQFFFSGKEQQEFIQTTRMVPGALDAVTKAAEGTGKNMTEMARYMLVARGAGLTTGEGAKLLDISYRQFGESSMPKVSEELAKFASAAKATGVPVGIAMDQIKSASAPLAIFGGKMAEARGVWTAFTTSLKDVPVDEVGKLTQTVAQNVAQMGLGTQAFVAQMSGMVHGVTALGGALRMELAMREPGGMERNLEKVMQTISRMGGGRIITLQEAAQTPALEMQFQLQRQMVNQMLGVQGGQQQARVLEVLQNMERGGASGAQASKNIQDLMSDGQKAQEASVTAMDKMAMGLSRTNGFLQEIIKVENAAAAELKGIGTALGASGVGDVPRRADFARAGLATGRAGQAAVGAVPQSLERMGRLARTAIGGTVAGVRAFARERNWRARRAPGGAPIDVEQPERTEPPLFARPLPRVAPWTTSQERRTQRAGMMMPIAWEREPEQGPMPAPAPGALGARGAGRVPARPAAETEAEGERYLAAPMEAANVRISVVCEKCLEKKIYEVTRKGSREAKGDHY